MFDSLHESYDCLANDIWGEIFGNTINNSQFKDMIKKEFDLSQKEINKFIKAQFTDLLELLVKRDIYHQVYDWRCNYCGHFNLHSIDMLKKANPCEICQKYHYPPIDFEWKYKLNDFVLNSLVIHNGLTVLWTLGYLASQPLITSFYYLPEVSLYLDRSDKYPKEIDCLCVINGKFYAGEVKQSASQFLHSSEQNKFIEKIERIRPDIAFIAFEKYINENDPNLKTEEYVKVEIENFVDKIKNINIRNMKVQIFLLDNNLSLYPFGKRAKDFFY